MKKIMFVLVVLGLLFCTAAVFAQGAFVDVPTDHWAYDAVNQLQRAGIIVGYPDGTFGGKRAMTRYEFAVAIARLLPLLGDNVNVNGGVSSADLNAALAPYAKKGDIPAFNGASKADLDAIKRLVNEFSDELASLGVDVDALKRDVANLTARVEALEAENRRVRFTGNVDVIGITGSGDATDFDGYDTAHKTLDRVNVLTNFDLNLVGRVNDKITANATINYGNYLNYYNSNRDKSSYTDDFYPYYLYIDANLADNANLTVGRFPIQWTPYTLKRVDNDTYSSLLNIDDGNYAFDGAKFDYSIWGVNFEMFAAKNDQGDYGFGQFNNAIGAFGGTEFGYNFTQSAGARAEFGFLDRGKVGATYYQAWSQDAKNADWKWDQLRVWGADLALPLGKYFTVNGSWTTDQAIANDNIANALDYDKDTDAWDANLAAKYGNFGFDAGYKRIEQNFYTAGDWGSLGMYTNPSNVKGFYGDINYDFTNNFSAYANVQALKGITDDITTAIDDTDDRYTNVVTGVKWGFTATDSISAEYNYLRYKNNNAANLKDKQTFTTLAYAHKFSPNATLSLGYQFINDKTDTNAGRIFKNSGNRAVAQFGVSF